MEKNINWHEITYQSSELNQVPCKRWGHKIVHIEDQIVLFGGFSDVTYLNDLWAYNIVTNKWRQIETTGIKPEGKSNFTMHYDTVTNQLLIFGGGGPNKRRFNKVSILNWITKQWSEHQQLENSQQQAVNNNEIPWQRTYHSSQFKYPYLIMFGGQGAGNIDLDDLWVFNVETHKWTEIKVQELKNDTNIHVSSLNNNAIEGRKFHSTAMVENELFVIAGCRSNYTCIPNIYSIDLSSLYNKTFTKTIKSKQNKKYQQNQSNNNEAKQYSEQSELQNNLGNNINNDNKSKQFISKQQYSLQYQDTQKVYCWKKHSLKEKQISLIEKWGHSSESYNGKIYLFGGRNQQDFNDLIEYNPKTQTLTKLSPLCNHGNKLPKSRRRHSSCMVGCSMLIFGGFNLQYFNDLQYISLFPCKDTLKRENYSIQKIQGYELIELQQEIFHHFMQEMCKDKPQYDIELWIESLKHKQPVILRSVETMMRKKSQYFDRCLEYNPSSNPEHRTLTIPLKNLNVGMLSFQIFNTFLIKDLLILPKQCKLKKLYELLICADYFMVKPLFDLIENILTLRVIDETESIDDIFNIAANFKLKGLMKVCAEKKILNQILFHPNTKTIPLNNMSAAKIKTMYIEAVLQEIRFDQIQKGPKNRIKNCYLNLDYTNKQNFLIEEKASLSVQNIEVKRRKKSFVTKFMESFTKFCSPTPSSQQIRVHHNEIQRSQNIFSDEDDDQYQIHGNEIKMF